MTSAPTRRAGELHAVGELRDFPFNRFRVLEVNGRSIGVVRTRHGFYAVRNSCPHQMAPICQGRITGTNLPSRPGQVVYGLRDRLLRCPWHGFEFFLETGEAAFGTSSKRLVTYPVTIVDGLVLVEIRKQG